MKTLTNTLSGILCLLFISTISLAQPIHLDEEQVPAKVKIGFNEKYPHAEDPIWQKEENGLYTAQYWDIENDIYITAYHEEDGTWFKSVMEVTPDAFTEALRQYFKTNYEEVPISTVYATQEPGGKVTFKVLLELEDKLLTLIMDKRANIIEQIEENIQVSVTDDDK